MISHLLPQLFVSFLAGGCFITFLSLTAERAKGNVAGIILMFPSTMVLGFFFLGMATSAEKVAEVVPASFVPLGVLVLSSIFYIYLAQFYARLFAAKTMQIILAFSTCSLIWLCLALPFAIFKFKSLWAGILIYFFLMLIGHSVINQQKMDAEIQKPSYTKRQIVFRSLFVGVIIALVVLLGKTLNPFWGGVLTMYPAATFAALIAFHYYYEPHQLFFFFRRAPIGSLLLFTYAVSVRIFFPLIGFVWGTLAACLMSVLLSMVLLGWLKRLDVQ